MTSFRYNGVTTNRKEFLYGIRTQILLPSKIHPRLRTTKLSQKATKDEFEEYAKKVIDRAYFIILNKIDELDGTNERLLKYYKENIEKHKKI